MLINNSKIKKTVELYFPWICAIVITGVFAYIKSLGSLEEIKQLEDSFKRADLLLILIVALPAVFLMRKTCLFLDSDHPGCNKLLRNGSLRKRFFSYSKNVIHNSIICQGYIILTKTAVNVFCLEILMFLLTLCISSFIRQAWVLHIVSKGSELKKLKD